MSEHQHIGRILLEGLACVLAPLVAALIWGIVILLLIPVLLLFLLLSWLLPKESPSVTANIPAPPWTSNPTAFGLAGMKPGGWDKRPEPSSTDTTVGFRPVALPGLLEL